MSSMDDKEWREQAEVLLQDATIDVLEYESTGWYVYCHFCNANQNDENIPFARIVDDIHSERHHDNCWVLRVERLLKQ